MAYISTAEYAQLTGGQEVDATAERLASASRLLDMRIGSWVRRTSGTYDGYKIDLDDSAFNAFQVEAIKRWTAWMLKYLVDNNDQIVGAKSVTLGRFKVEESGDDNALREMALSDSMLVDAEMVRL